MSERTYTQEEVSNIMNNNNTVWLRAMREVNVSQRKRGQVVKQHGAIIASLEKAQKEKK